MAGTALRVVGIDPGSRVTGWGVIESQGSTLTLVEAGCIAPNAALPMAKRLAAILKGLAEILERTAPHHAAVEEVFFAKNVKSALALGQARGVALAALAGASVEVHEYSPAEVKRAIVGGGRADKEQVAHMVRVLLGPKEKQVHGVRLDVTDACAIAICHANTWHSRLRVAG